jgi:hypothetical protein
VDSAALSALWVLLSGVLLCFYVLRPGTWLLIRRSPEGEGVSDMQVSGLPHPHRRHARRRVQCTDAIGIHSVFGAFV